MVDLPAARKDWPADWRHDFEERAGIMEYDGRLTRAEAERRAEALCRLLYRRQAGKV
jgi:hypothetical protein